MRRFTLAAFFPMLALATAFAQANEMPPKFPEVDQARPSLFPSKKTDTCPIEIVPGKKFGSIALGAELLHMGWWCAHAAVWLALIALLVAAPRIVASPCSH